MRNIQWLATSRSTLLTLLTPLALGPLACASSSSTAPAPAPSAVAPNTPDAKTPRLEMLSASPTLGDNWFESWFAWDGFPAISEDGTVIINTRRLHDGARGSPNLRVEAFAVSDGHLVFESVILEPSDEGSFDLELSLTEPQLAAIRANFDKARRYLAGRRWHTLDPLARSIEDAELDDSVPSFTPDGSIAVVLNEPELIVDLASESRTFIKDVHAWSAPPNRDGCFAPAPGEPPIPDPMPEEDCVCTNPSGIFAAWSDLTRGVLVIEVGYTGTDSCWEPESRLLPVRLPNAKSKGWKRGARSADLLAFDRDHDNLPTSIETPEDQEALQAYLARWERRFPDAPDVKAARAIK